VRVIQNPAVVESLRQELDRGEWEAVALAMELQAPLLIDEVRGRRIASLYRVPVRGALGLLLEARQAGYVASLSEEFRKLAAEDFRVSARLIQDLLRAAGEEQE